MSKGSQQKVVVRTVRSSCFILLYVVVWNIFSFSPRSLGRWSNFDKHIFQMGWFNHQLVTSWFMLNMNESQTFAQFAVHVLHPLKLTDSSPLKSYLSKRKGSSEPTIHFQALLLMAEIPNNHLGWCWNPIDNGKKKLSTSAGELIPDFSRQPWRLSYRTEAFSWEMWCLAGWMGGCDSRRDAWSHR